MTTMRLFVETLRLDTVAEARHTHTITGVGPLARATGPGPGPRPPMRTDPPGDGHVAFAAALAALGRLYMHCESIGDAALMARTTVAFDALMGQQPHLDRSTFKP